MSGPGEYVFEYNPDIIMISESWAQDSDIESWAQDSDIESWAQDSIREMELTLNGI